MSSPRDSPSIALQSSSHKPTRTSRNGYTSLNDAVSDDEDTTTADSTRQRFRDDEADAEGEGEGEGEGESPDLDETRPGFSNGHETVRLLPVSKSPRPDIETPTYKSDEDENTPLGSSDNEEETLKNDRALLSDVEGGGDPFDAPLVLNGNGDHHGMLSGKGAWRKRFRWIDTGHGKWRTKLHSLWEDSSSRVDSWWQDSRLQSLWQDSSSRVDSWWQDSRMQSLWEDSSSRVDSWWQDSRLQSVWQASSSRVDSSWQALRSRWPDTGPTKWRSKVPSPCRFYSWWLVFALLTAVLVVIIVAVIGSIHASQETVEYPRSPPWYPTPRGGTRAGWHKSYVKAKDLVGKMTLAEKVNVTTGTGWQMGLCVGNTGPAELVKFPSLCLQDGPLGIRYADNITAFPAGITTGATWNRELMRARGLALGEEAKLKGVNVVLGPSMGPMGMMPAGGRNWEGFGSDPVLQAVAAAETIRGIQHHGVMATAKHFVLNEQEHFRMPFEWGIPTALSSNIDDRSLHEVFVWPFAESIRAGVGSVMCSYQMVNNSYACENSKLLNGILKDELGFQGFVQSDWLAQRSGVNSALGGLDMSMPGDGLHWADGKSLWGSHLTRAVLNTSVPMVRLNDMVTRIVAAWYQLRQDSWEKPPKGGPNFSSWTHNKIGRLHEGSPGDQATGVVNHYVNAQGTGSQAHFHLARKIAAEGIVLVKNKDNLLPLSRNVSLLSRDTPSPDRKYRVGIFGKDAGPGRGPNACPDRGCNQGTLGSGWGSGAVDFPYLVSPWEVLKSAWPKDTVETRAYLNNDEVTVDDMNDQDLCLVFANSDGGEGFIHKDGIDGDRNDLFLQQNGSHLVAAVGQVCGGGQGKTVVIVHSIGPVVLDHWVGLPGIYGVLLANLPGQESGNALADVLFGDVDASGRLPYTIPYREQDYGERAQVLYETDEPVPQVNFTERGLYIDYRFFDKHEIEPRYEFGFGLSYTNFSLSDLQIKPLQNKTRLPSPRPSDEFKPPTYDNRRPNPSDVLVPDGFRTLKKYIYPYLESLSGTSPAHYSYPEGYNIRQRPSPAGGGLGGNPSLFEPILELSLNVTNIGPRHGKDVVQIYVSFPEGVTEPDPSSDEEEEEEIEFPVRVLRNFEKVDLNPGKSTIVHMNLTRKDLSYWSVRAQNWVLPTEGTFGIWAGHSSRDLPLNVEF